MAVRVIDPVREEVLIKLGAEFAEDWSGLGEFRHALAARRHDARGIVTNGAAELREEQTAFAALLAE